MTTACVSAFYDVGDVLYQNRKNNQLKTQFSAERRATIGASTMGNNTRNRNFSTGSFVATNPQVTGVNITQCVISNGELREHRKLDRSLSEPVGDKNLNNLNNQRNQANINSSRYKTELCRPFEEMGHCKYGDKCQFAHGSHELRTLNRHPKYKTELCRTYHTIGFCPYGPRCHFVHNDEDKPAEGNQNQTGNSPVTVQSQSPPHPILSRQSSPPLQQPQVKRPSTINFNSSFSGSLGSVADSPPSSLSNSPSMSPTFVGEDIYALSSCNTSQFSGSSSTSSSPVFDFSASDFGSQIASLLKPLNVQTQITNNTIDINTLQQQFNVILNLNQRNNNHTVFGDMELNGGAPSPQDSISGDSSYSSNSLQSCGSPLDISKSLRLPIFNQLSHD